MPAYVYAIIGILGAILCSVGLIILCYLKRCGLFRNRGKQQLDQTMKIQATLETESGNFNQPNTARNLTSSSSINSSFTMHTKVTSTKRDLLEWRRPKTKAFYERIHKFREILIE